MLKFYFPKNLEKCKPYLSQTAIKNDLMMIVEENGEMKAICSFIYSKGTSIIYQLISIEKEMDLPLMDGLFRAVMFHLMEMECNSVIIESVPEEMNAYFENLGFDQQSGGWCSDHFSDLLFSGCPGCKGAR